MFLSYFLVAVWAHTPSTLCSVPFLYLTDISCCLFPLLWSFWLWWDWISEQFWFKFPFIGYLYFFRKMSVKPVCPLVGWLLVLQCSSSWILYIFKTLDLWRRAEKGFPPCFRVNLHSSNSYHGWAEALWSAVILFVNSGFYFLSCWSPIQRVIPYMYSMHILKEYHSISMIFSH